jgi:hypothetical protein
MNSEGNHGDQTQAAAQWNSTRPGWQSIEMLQATDPGPTSSVEPRE